MYEYISINFLSVIYDVAPRIKKIYAFINFFGRAIFTLTPKILQESFNNDARTFCGSDA